MAPSTRATSPPHTGAATLRRGKLLLLVAPSRCAQTWSTRVLACLRAGGWTPLPRDERQGGAAIARVVVAPQLDQPDTQAWLASTMDQGRRMPTVLVTSGGAANLKELRRFIVDEVITDLELETELHPRLIALAALSLREQIASAARHCHETDPVVSKIIVTVCAREPRVRTGKALLRHLRLRSRTSLWRHWHAAPHALGALSDFLRIVSLVEYVELRQAGTSCLEARLIASIGKSTLHDSARRYFRVTPAALIQDPTPLLHWSQAVITSLYASRAAPAGGHAADPAMR